MALNIKSKLGRSFWLRSFYSMALWVYKYPSYIRDYVAFSRMARKDGRFEPHLADSFPCLFDNTKTTGFDPHYTYHPAWAARIVAKNRPSKHIDISSILHFSTLVSAFVPVEFYDYRPAEVRLKGLACRKGDLTRLPFADDSVESISCMHTIEHVGLGRYGDPLDAAGDLQAVNELKRVVKPGGTLIFVTPIGKPKIEYNAHRIYSYDQVMSMFEGMELREFSLVPDDFKKEGLVEHASKDLADAQTWGCGCFWFVKK